MPALARAVLGAAQRDALLEGEGDGGNRGRGEAGGGEKTQTRKGLDKEVRLLEHIQDRRNGPTCLLQQGGHLRGAVLQGV